MIQLCYRQQPLHYSNCETNQMIKRTCMNFKTYIWSHMTVLPQSPGLARQRVSNNNKRYNTHQQINNHTSYRPLYLWQRCLIFRQAWYTVSLLSRSTAALPPSSHSLEDSKSLCGLEYYMQPNHKFKIKTIFYPIYLLYSMLYLPKLRIKLSLKINIKT